MKNDLHSLLAHLRNTVLFAVMVTLPVALLYLDIHWLKDNVGEWSLVELTQLGFLFASALAFVRLARRRADDRRFAVLAAALFACMLIRELDAVWDLLFRGLWSLLVTAVAGSALAYALRDWRAALAGLVRFLGSRPGTLMTIGLVMLLFYSRLFGMTALWQGLLEEGYIRIFKNAVEETTELLGYSFILAASLTYAARRIRERSKALARAVSAAPVAAEAKGFGRF